MIFFYVFILVCLLACVSGGRVVEGDFQFCQPSDQVVDIGQSRLETSGLMLKHADEFFRLQSGLVLYSSNGWLYHTRCQAVERIELDSWTVECTRDLRATFLAGNAHISGFLTKTGVLRDSSTPAACSNESEFFNVGPKDVSIVRKGNHVSFTPQTMSRSPFNGPFVDRPKDAYQWATVALCSILVARMLSVLVSACRKKSTPTGNRIQRSDVATSKFHLEVVAENYAKLFQELDSFKQMQTTLQDQFKKQQEMCNNLAQLTTVSENAETKPKAKRGRPKLSGTN